MDRKLLMVKPIRPTAKEQIEGTLKPSSILHSQGSPTFETYDALSEAARHFNEQLFGSVLPEALITLDRTIKAAGSFCGNRFASTTHGELSDQITLNPEPIPHVRLEATLAVLVHEQCHQWQFHYSSDPKRIGRNRAYHDKEWGAKMAELGLMPSTTGAPGGRKTGQRMSHYIIPGGKFHNACQELLERGFNLPWLDRTLELVLATLSEAKARRLKEQMARTARKKDRQKASKTKFTCPRCGLNAWAKPSAKIGCLGEGCSATRMTAPTTEEKG